MLAINHVTLATAVTLGGSIYLDIPFFLPFIAFVVFSSLLPDIDHPGSEVSNYFPFVNKLFKHRGVTHSILGLGVFSGSLYLLLNYNRVLSIILIVVALIGTQYLGELIKRRLNQFQNASKNFISEKQIRLAIRWFMGIMDIFLIILAFLIWNEKFRQEIIILLIVGYAGHILGDYVTRDGIPLLWPIKKRQGLKIFRTGSSVEGFIGFLLIIANIYLIFTFWNQFNLNNLDYWKTYLNFL